MHRPADAASSKQQLKSHSSVPQHPESNPAALARLSPGHGVAAFGYVVNAGLESMLKWLSFPVFALSLLGSAGMDHCRGGCGPLGAVLGLKAIAAVYRADLFWLVVGAGDVPVGGCV
ncbi:hypothetical protein Nepgr_021040 [Nepenthes gracilis]|uniref:Uncharacterized protein n=1 Tax=Nepenthes gracilis TaxID=150966 RepID=A0AAD3XWP5_NEPGR|nr:hypothetical protein Nepgr_021040 [Nepenthes gracilis]